MKGKTHDEAREAVHPETGLPGKSGKLTAYALNQWLERRNTRPVPSRHGALERIAEATHKPDPLEAERRHIIAAAHAVSSEKGVKLSDLLDEAAAAAEEGSEIRQLLERSANRFRHLPAPKYPSKALTGAVMAYRVPQNPVEGG